MSSSKSNKELLKFIEYYLTNINESSSKNLEFEIRFGRPQNHFPNTRF